MCQGGGTTASELFGGLLSVHVVFLVGSQYSSIQTNPCSSPSANAQKTKEIQTLLPLPPPSPIAMSNTLPADQGRGKRKRTEKEDTNKEEEDDEKVPSRSGGRVARLRRSGKPSYYFAIPWNMINKSFLF